MQHARGGVKIGAGLGCDLAAAASVARAGQGLTCGGIPRWGAAQDPPQGRRQIPLVRKQQHRDFAGGAVQWLRIPTARSGGHGLRAQSKPGTLGQLAWNLVPCGTRLQSSSAPEAANRDSQPPPVTEEIPDGASSVEEAHEVRPSSPLAMILCSLFLWKRTVAPACAHVLKAVRLITAADPLLFPEACSHRDDQGDACIWAAEEQQAGHAPCSAVSAVSCASCHWPLFCRHSLFHISPSPHLIFLSSLPLPSVSRFKSPPSLFSPPSPPSEK